MKAKSATSGPKASDDRRRKVVVFRYLASSENGLPVRMEQAAPTRRHKARGARGHQFGAYAVEYALIFPVFFALLYGTLAYGFIFTMRMGLQHAAEEGAREALRYQVATNPGDTQIALREAAAETVARVAATWIQNMGSLTVKADVCLQTDLNCLPTSGAAEQPDTLDCGETLAEGCQIVVTVEFPYQSHPVFPSVLGLVMPATLQGRAHALLDGRAMSSTL